MRAATTPSRRPRASRLVLLLAVAASAVGCPDAGTDPGYNPRNPMGEGPAPVEIGEAADLASPGAYVLLAKAGISNVTGSSVVVGHVAISPAAGSFITGFSLTADPSNTFSTSSSVVSPARVYAADDAVPTPSNLTAAVLHMEAAYTDAASRSPADELNLSDGDLGGLTLAPGLYSWGSSVTIPGDLTFAGGEDDVWILQISGDLDLSAAQSVVLSGGASPSNIFWQVAGATTMHANAHFEGVLVSSTSIVLQTNASFVGRALAQTMIALDDNSVTAP